MVVLLFLIRLQIFWFSLARSPARSPFLHMLTISVFLHTKHRTQKHLSILSNSIYFFFLLSSSLWLQNELYLFYLISIDYHLNSIEFISGRVHVCMCFSFYINFFSISRYWMCIQCYVFPTHYNLHLSICRLYCSCTYFFYQSLSSLSIPCLFSIQLHFFVLSLFIENSILFSISSLIFFTIYQFTYLIAIDFFFFLFYLSHIILFLIFAVPCQ